jgi:hypothetical protein
MIREYVVAMRFLTTMGHFLALLILNNIRISLGDGVSAADELVAQQTAIAALVIGIFCFMFDFRGMFFGSSLFNHTVRNIIVPCFLFSLSLPYFSHLCTYPMFTSDQLYSDLVSFRR